GRGDAGGGSASSGDGIEHGRGAEGSALAHRLLLVERGRGGEYPGDGGPIPGASSLLRGDSWKQPRSSMTSNVSHPQKPLGKQLDRRKRGCESSSWRCTWRSTESSKGPTGRRRSGTTSSPTCRRSTCTRATHSSLVA